MSRTPEAIQTEIDVALLPLKPNRSKIQRLHAEHRAALIDALGMEPEDLTSAGSRYAATTGELVKWYREAMAKALEESTG